MPREQFNEVVQEFCLQAIKIAIQNGTSVELDAEWEKLMDEVFFDFDKRPDLLEKGRKAIEDVLVDRRDSRIAILGRGNGLVIRKKDGTDSHIIRMTTEEALQIGIKAMQS